LTPVAVIAVITVIGILVLPAGIGVVGLTSPHVLTSYEGSILVAKGEASVSPFIAADRIRSAPVAVAGIAAVVTVASLIVAPTAIAILPTFVSAIVAVGMIAVAVIPTTVIAIMVVTISAIAPMVARAMFVIIIAALCEAKTT
jgi:hypothetical protein